MTGAKGNPVALGQRVGCGDHQGEVVTRCPQGARVRFDDGRVRFTLDPGTIGGAA